MKSNIQNRTLSKALRLMICTALALVITSVTTQVIVSSAGQHEYGMAPSNLAAHDTSADIGRRIIVAQVR
jgi:hypothetical protein